MALWDHHRTTRMAKPFTQSAIQQTSDSVNEWWWQMESRTAYNQRIPIPLWWECKLGQSFCETFCQYPLYLNTCIFHELAVLILKIHPTEIQHAFIFKAMMAPEVYKKALKWKHFKWLSMIEKAKCNIFIQQLKIRTDCWIQLHERIGEHKVEQRKPDLQKYIP